MNLPKELPETFTCTSDAPYDRHWYKVWCKDDTCKVLHSYAEVYTVWWNFKELISNVEVIDVKQRGGNGF